MTPAIDGSATGTATPTDAASPPYGGGGAGGKFRRKPFRGRQATPYDRPSTALRPNNDINSRGWLTKLVVDPATKLISYGADRFIASIFKRKQLPPPPTPTEVKDDENDSIQEVVSNNHHMVHEPARDQSSPPIDVPSNDSVFELEQLLKQKTFTRTEIIHLTELLRSKAKELSNKDDDVIETTDMPSKLAISSLEENRTIGVRSAAVSTPLSKAKVLDDDIIASPVELAKSYMGSRPSKVSPSSLAIRSQTGREATCLLGNTPFSSKSSSMSLTKKTFGGLGAPENGFITPRSRGRSAIYNMARTPYSRINSSSTLKGNGVIGNGYTGTSLSPASLVVHNDELEKPTSLKRRNTVLGDDIGSIGPIRRIRQKPNLLAPRVHHAAHGMVMHSDLKQKGHLIGEIMHDASKTIKESENRSGPSTSYAHVPSKSTEVAARIFQQLEKLSPAEKSSQSKLVTAQEKSHLELKPRMLSGQALRSMENAEESLKMRLDAKDVHDLPGRSDSGLPGAFGVSSKNQGSEEKNVIKGSMPFSDTLNHTSNNAALSLKASGPSLTADSVRVAPALPKKNAFRMSAVEDLVDQDDDITSNELAQIPSSENGSMMAPLSDSKLLPAEKPEVVKPTIHAEVKPPTTFEITQGGSAVFPATEKVNKSFESPSPSASAKLEEANKPSPLFGFSPAVANNFSTFSSESRQKQESKQGISNSLLNVPVSVVSHETSPEPDKVDHRKSLTAVVANGKSESMPLVQSNGLQVPKPLFGSFTAASSSDTNQTAVENSLSLTSPVSVPSFVPTGTGIFGSAAKPPEPVVKFGTPVDQPAMFSAAPLTNVSEDLKRKVDNDSSLASLSTFTPSATTSSASGTFGHVPSFSNSTSSNNQSSLFANAMKSPVPTGVATSQGASGDLPLSESLPFSTDAAKAVPENGPSSNVFKFGMGSSAGSDKNAVISSSNSATASALFSFGLKSSSSANTVGTSTVATPPTFVFGGSSSVSSSLNNNASTFTSGTSGIFNIGSNSSASSVVNSVGTNSATSNAFGSSLQDQKTSPFGSTTTTPGFSFGASSTASTSSTTPQSSVFSFGASSTPSASTNPFAPSSSTGLYFGASSTPLASTNISPVFTSSAGSASPSPVFSFTTASATPSFTPSIFGGSTVTGFGASPGNNDQMNSEDTMAEDPVQSTTQQSFPVFGQPSGGAPGFTFGAAGQSQGNPFAFGGQQQNQVPNPSPFQASGSLDFNAGGSFSLGSGGGDKSGRKIVKINRNRNRKK